MKIRVTDGVSHAEEFTATNLRTFRINAHRALSRFPKPYTLLQLHVMEQGEWFSVPAYHHIPGHRSGDAFVGINLRLLFARAEYMWRCAEWVRIHGNIVTDFVRDIRRDL